MKHWILGAAFALFLPASAADAPPAATETNLASLAAGAWIVKRPSEYDASWSAHWLLDERSDSGWATRQGDVGPQEIGSRAFYRISEARQIGLTRNLLFPARLWIGARSHK